MLTIKQRNSINRYDCSTRFPCPHKPVNVLAVTHGFIEQSNALKNRLSNDGATQVHRERRFSKLLPSSLVTNCLCQPHLLNSSQNNINLRVANQIRKLQFEFVCGP